MASRVSRVTAGARWASVVRAAGVSLERAPRLRADDSVDDQLARLLEADDRGLGDGSEDAVHEQLRAAPVVDRLLEAADRLPARATSEHRPRRRRPAGRRSLPE